MNFIDLLYFGHEPDSKTLEDCFISEIKEIFPDVKLSDAYDNIKGYRQEVTLPELQNDNYYAWIIAHGWSGCSLNTQLLRMGRGNHEELKGYINLAKELFPDKIS